MKGSTRRIVVATGNAGKLREITELMAASDVVLVAQATLGVIPCEETGTTFLANALQKARNAAKQTGLGAMADDSGLVVDALAGDPGVRSARFAGAQATDQQNVDKLLAALRGIVDRAAHFHCAAVYVRNADDPHPLVAQGRWCGEISDAPQGTGGFGYDPVFYDPLHKCTSAELTADEKNARSHRGHAMRSLYGMMLDRWGAPGSVV